MDQSGVARAGFPLGVWNRSAGRGASLAEFGATEHATPAELARASDIVVVCVSDTPDVEAVLLGPSGIADGAAAGSLVIDCSTISPDATRRFAERLGERDVRLIHAPGRGG